MSNDKNTNKSKNMDAPTPVVDSTEPESMTAAAPEKELTIQESIAAKIKSRSAKPVILDGRASRFDLRRYSEHDFTAGGQLSPRFAAKTDERISQLKAEGYDFPENWDPRLPKVEVSGLVLMLRSSEHSKIAADWHLENARALDRSKAPSEAAKSIAPDQRDGAEFMEFTQEKQQDVVMGADVKSRVMGPE